MNRTTTDADRARVVDEIRRRRRFVVVSHVRPDGDAIGSSLAMAYALRQLGKDARVLSRDAAPQQLADFPGVADIEITPRVDDPGEAVLVMECGELARTGVEGLERGFVVNIDHHPGNAGYGALNWLDLSAAACGEMVFDLVRALDVPLTLEIATHVYVAIVTDTGSFHYANITPRTFDICRQCVEAGVSPPQLARTLFDSNSLAKLKLSGAVLNRMRLGADGRVATLAVDERLLGECGATYDDTDGLINQPLTVKDILAVAFFKEQGPQDWRVSMRSKGDVDINAVAKEFGGGGHKNASGCNARGSLDELMRIFERKMTTAIEKTATSHRDTETQRV
jgi:phosphoesterase RecJ-like protein